LGWFQIKRPQEKTTWRGRGGDVGNICCSQFVLKFVSNKKVEINLV